MEFDKTYKFTNENLSSYNNLYNFKSSKILSVIGSGDQYFSSLLFGAEDIVLFDKNEIAKYYFIFKFYALRTLTYEQFIDYFIVNKLTKGSYYKIIRHFLPSEVKWFFDKISKDSYIGEIVYPFSINNHKINFSSDRVIPYFDKERYYKLQSLLKERELPVIISSYLEQLDISKLSNFDIMLFSNIYLYLNMNKEEYIKFLNNKYKNHLNSDGVIQANYTWTNCGTGYGDFVDRENDGFYIDEVDSVRYDGKNNFKDYVLTYRK